MSKVDGLPIMPSILITGASGFIGKSAAQGFLRAGWSVRCAVREIPSFLSMSGAEWVVVGNIDDKTDWSAALDNIDCVLHLAAKVHVTDTKIDARPYCRADVEGTRHLVASAVNRKIRRFIYMSSIGVNGNITQRRRFTEEDSPAPINVYTSAKLEAERVVAKMCTSGPMEYVIVRPPLVYGPGVGANFMRLMQCVDKGLPLPFAAIKNKRSFIYIENLVDALLVCAVHPDAKDQIYLVCDNEEVSTPELIHLIAEAMGKKANLWFCPIGLLELGAKMLGRSIDAQRLLGSLQVDASKIRNELGWSPSISARDGVNKTVKWFWQNAS